MDEAIMREWFSAVVRVYLAALAVEGIGPSDELMIAAVLGDLCAVAGCPVPEGVALLLGEWPRGDGGAARPGGGPPWVFGVGAADSGGA